MQTIVKMVFGSHLYGTATEKSDTDIKGIFMPSREQILLQRVPNSIGAMSGILKKEGQKNTSADTDLEMYSLHYFLKLALQGETVALDMLHAPDSALIEVSSLWRELVKHRQRFYTKNLKSFVGYARRQAAKYGVKGSRLSEARMVLESLKSLANIYRVGDYIPRVGEMLDKLPRGEHISIVETDVDILYTVCGKGLSSKAHLDHYIPMLQTFVDTYGNRAQEAAENKGIDWKAVSHAFRAAYQVKHILKVGGYTYPLPETETIRLVKGGQLDWLTVVQPMLENLMDEVETLSRNSTLPEKPDQKFWDEWLMSYIGSEVVGWL